MSPLKERHMLPPEELRCVWMTSGILSYRLCDREFDCENCALDAAMRRQSGQPGGSRDSLMPQNGLEAISEQLREELLYSRNHCWAKKIVENVVRVGLEPGLSHALLMPKGIVLPSKGQSVQRRQTCLWIVIEGGTLPLESPCDGVVRATNHQLTAQPNLIVQQPFDEGWLFDLESKESSFQLVGFLNPNEARSAYAADQSRFTILLANASHPNRPPIGTTMADGGQRLQSTADILGPAKYFSILQKVF